MPTTVAQLLARVARDLHESDPTFPSGDNQLWSLLEMLQYVNYAESDFLRRTGIIKADVSIPVTAGGPRVFTKPTASAILDIERMSFAGKRIRRVTNWDLEREDALWRTRIGRPRQYHEDHLPVHQFEIDRIPDRDGALRIFADRLPDDLISTTDYLNVPDTWVPAIQWCVLAQSLSRDGDGQDVARGQYAWQRYQFWVALAKRLMTGASVSPGVAA
jgi:hypothetical protein